MEPGGTTGPSEAPVQVKVVQIPAKCLSSTTPQPSAEAAAMVDQQGVTKVVSTAVRPQQPSSSSVSLSGQQASTSVVVITKRAVPASSAVVRQVAPLYQGPPPVRTVMFTMPTPVATHTAAVSHRPAAPASQTPQLPANIQIPAGEPCKAQCKTCSLVTMGFFLDRSLLLFPANPSCQEFDTNFLFMGFALIIMSNGTTVGQD